MLPSDTPRLRFREMASADLDDFAVMLGDPDMMRFYPAPKSREEAAGWIAWNRRNYAAYGFGLWAIETHDGSFVGDCGLTWQPVNGVELLEVGYHVIPSFQGRGLAAEAAAACRDLAREHGIAPNLVAIIHPENVASQRVAKKIGMAVVDEDHGHHSTPSRVVMGMAL